MSRPELIATDPYLAPYEEALRWRHRRFRETLAALETAHGSLGDFANGHLHFGIHRTEGGGWRYREWAPAANALSLVGDFNGWDRRAHPLIKRQDGTWDVTLPPGTLVHGSRVKVHVVSRRGAEDRIPLFARRVVQDPATLDFAAQVWEPEAPHVWQNDAFRAHPRAPRFIYEAHVGMAQEAESVGTYRAFADCILPRIAQAGYDTVQLMAIMEHPYYGSFGYHVANFFAPTSRFGTPEDLKYLIDAAHGLGLAVLLDVVHSHAAKNTREGVNEFDGTSEQLFHAGERGDHPLWDSKLFDYGKPGVQHFLLSNLRYWLDEFHFDGFRFDGVTSMMYLHHGLGTAFDHYDKYFVTGVDVDGVTYLQLANHLVRQLRPDAVTIAEDVSGMPGIATPIAQGGLGFDYRLAMGLPDYWVKLVTGRKDEDWSPGEILHALENRRRGERHVAYVESHDQCLVGDKTLAFRLMDSAMYWHMGLGAESVVVDRGVALHKLIRLVTLAAGGEAWLNFMGNEFGHPEWVDFPREGNGWSHRHARRQWSLADDARLRYQHLAAFDRAMLREIREYHVLEDPALTRLYVHEEQKVLAFRRGPLIFAFNFHPETSWQSLAIPGVERASYTVVLDSDARELGGHGRVDANVVHFADPDLRLYLPSRTALVLRPNPP